MSQEPGDEKRLRVEKTWEGFLWSGRFLVLIAVAASLLASLMLFVVGALDIIRALGPFRDFLLGVEVETAELDLVSGVIGAVDTFLIAIVLLVFCFGLYELFISEIDPAKKSGSASFLIVPNLDALKEKIAKVIVMALIVKFFQVILTIKSQTNFEIFLFAASILLLALSAFALQIHPRRPKTVARD
ncbi:MAG TPA: YqhA family protein [Rectinemataceae bacterium]|nr:YqhA family protein [Rectinemataceae bacterium]